MMAYIFPLKHFNSTHKKCYMKAFEYYKNTHLLIPLICPNCWADLTSISDTLETILHLTIVPHKLMYVQSLQCLLYLNHNTYKSATCFYYSRSETNDHSINSSNPISFWKSAVSCMSMAAAGVVVSQTSCFEGIYLYKYIHIRFNKSSSIIRLQSVLNYRM